MQRTKSRGHNEPPKDSGIPSEHGSLNWNPSKKYLYLCFLTKTSHRKISMFWILFMPFPSCISQTIRENRAGGDWEEHRISCSVFLRDGCLDCFWEHTMFWDMHGEYPIPVLSIPDFPHAPIKTVAFGEVCVFVCFVAFFFSAQPKFPHFSSKTVFLPQSQCRGMHSLFPSFPLWQRNSVLFCCPSCHVSKNTDHYW